MLYIKINIYSCSFFPTNKIKGFILIIIYFFVFFFLKKIQGCYIFGNARLLCEKSELWNEIIANMEDGEKDMIGTKLNLKCAQHGTITKVQWPVDFTETQEGGCKRICGRVLDCGHQVME